MLTVTRAVRTPSAFDCDTGIRLFLSLENIKKGR